LPALQLGVDGSAAGHRLSLSVGDPGLLVMTAPLGDDALAHVLRCSCGYGPLGAARCGKVPPTHH